MKARRFEPGVALALLAAAALCAGPSAPAFAKRVQTMEDGPGRAAPAVRAGAAHVGSESLEAPLTRIYRSVGPDGAVTFGDRPEPGSKAMQIRTYASSSDARAVETANRQRQYWREKSDAFARRQQELREAEQQAAADRDRSSSILMIVVPHRLRAPAFGAATSPVDPALVSAQYRSSPGATAGAPAAFIGSGFSTATR